MPAASSSRRNTLPTKGRSSRNRAPSSDRIEEDPDSQPDEVDNDNLNDEDEDEDEQPIRPSRRVKKEKPTKNGRQSRPTADDDENEDQVNEDHADRIDVTNFKDQPLARSDASKFTGIIKDWEMVRKQSQSAANGLMENIGVSMADLMAEDESKKSLAELDIVMKDILDIEEEMILHEATVNDLYQQLCQGTPIEGVVDQYEKGVKKRLGEYRAKTTRQKYAKKPTYQTFREAIHEAQHPGAFIPPITEFIPKEDGDVSDDDDDLEVGGVTQDYKCPISLTILVNPLTSRVCNHSFSAGAIRDFLGPSRTRKQKCPASGCTRQICLEDLQPDKVLEKRVKAAERRLQRQERDEGSDGGEVVE